MSCICMRSFISRHPGAGRDPVNMLCEARLKTLGFVRSARIQDWVPACAGTTTRGGEAIRELFRTTVRLSGNDEGCGL